MELKQNILHLEIKFKGYQKEKETKIHNLQDLKHEIDNELRSVDAKISKIQK